MFGENLIELISPKNLNGKSFKSFYETRYTNWTIAAIVATQCGIPLKPMSIFNTKKKGKHQKHVFGLKHFLPNIKCLGDILKEDKDMVEDMLLAAMKNALKNAEKIAEDKMKAITGGGMPNLNIPGF